MAIAAIILRSAPHIVPVPLDVAQHNQVEVPIVVEIDPCGGGGPSAAADSGLLGYIGKCAVSIVVIKPVAAERGNVKILVAVVVIVAHGNTHAVSRAL